MAQTKEGAIKVSAKHYGFTIEEYLEKIKTENYCNKCKAWKNKIDFCVDKSRQTGLHKNCNTCRRVKIKKSTKGIPSKKRGIKITGQSLENMRIGFKKAGLKRKGKKKVYSEIGYQNLLKAIRKPRPSVRGQNHYNWKNGSNERLKNDRRKKEYSVWRTAVFERDKFTCQHCGDKKGGNLEAHHIKPFAQFIEERFVLENGITLCIKCHAKVHFKPNSTRNIKKKTT